MRILKHTCFLLITGLMLVSCQEEMKNKKTTTIKYPVNEQTGDIILGDYNAPETLFMYATYHCKYCRYFFSRTYPELKKNYLDKGKLKLVIKLVDFSDNTQTLYAWQAASCISQFGVYEKFHKLLLTNPDVIFSDDFNQLVDDIMQNNPEIEQCILENNDYSYLRNNVKEFRKNNLSGTPAFIVNKHTYSGFISYENIKKLLNKELNIKE
jgi:protein-disulfide isomerase